MGTFDYFHANETEQYLFVQLPLMLIKDAKFKKLSDSAKILYSLLLNRTALSAKNGWVDRDNNVYIIYTIEEIMNDLNCWQEKANKAMKELREIGLIKSVRQGLNKPNIIYVMNFATEYKYKGKGKEKEQKEPESAENTRTCENRKSELSKIENQNFRKSQSNQTYQNQNNFYTDLIYLSEEENFTNDTPIDLINKENAENITNNAENEINMLDDPVSVALLTADHFEIPALVADKICLAELKAEHADKHDEITELYNLVCQVLTTYNTNTLRIAKADVSLETVKQTFVQLDKSHFVYVLDCLSKNYNINKNPKNYFLTTLFNSVRTKPFYDSYNHRYSQLPANSSNNNNTNSSNNNSSFNLDEFIKANQRHQRRNELQQMNCSNSTI